MEGKRQSLEKQNAFFCITPLSEAMYCGTSHVSTKQHCNNNNNLVHCFIIIYVPVLNDCNVLMFYNSYFIRCSTSTCFILVQFIKHVLCDCSSVVSVNVNGICYVHVHEQER